MQQNPLKDKNVLVMGLGLFGGGLDSALFAAKHAKKVIVTDTADKAKFEDTLSELSNLENVELHLGGHLEQDFLDCDIVIANPAVPGENKYLKIAAENKKLITSQIEIFFELCPATIIGITGSNGKSTTTSLTYSILNAAAGQQDVKYSNVHLSGNIGRNPLLAKLPKITENDLVVLELSSFQLENLGRIRKSPFVAAVTNLAPNHLDRHGTFENYCDAKENILKFQSAGLVVLNKNDTICQNWFKKYKNDTNRKFVLFESANVDEQFRDVFKLPGDANLQNLAVAITIADYFGVQKSRQLIAVTEFKALKHRLELVCENKGIKWYNDSIATTPESTVVGLDAFDEPKILIAGGYDKGLDFDILAKNITKKAKAVILIGQTAKKIAEAIEKLQKNEDFQVFLADSMADAVEKAGNYAKKGDIVLMSPACASYDMFINFEQRGNEFAKLAKVF